MATYKAHTLIWGGQSRPASCRERSWEADSCQGKRKYPRAEGTEATPDEYDNSYGPERVEFEIKPDG